MFQEDHRTEKGKVTLGKANLHSTLLPDRFNHGQVVGGEFFMGQSSSATNPIIKDQQLIISDGTIPSLNAANQGQQERSGALTVQDWHASHLNQVITSASQPIQNVNGHERQFERSGGAGISKTNPADRAGLQDYDMEDLPNSVREEATPFQNMNNGQKLESAMSQQHMKNSLSLPLRWTTPDCTHKVPQHQINVGQGNTDKADESRAYVMQSEPTSGEVRVEKGVSTHIDKGEETRVKQACHGGSVRGVQVEAKGEGGGDHRQYHGGRVSGWDVPPPGFGILNSNPLEGTFFGTGSSFDRRYCSSRKMGVGPSVCRNKRQTMGQMAHPYPPPRKREGVLMEPTECDSPANRLPCASSPISSEASFSSNMGAFSQSHTIDYHQSALDVNLDTYKAGTPSSFQGESKPSLMDHGDTMAVSEPLRAEQMELDRAMVPAHMAPQAP
ncbi:hypothetical protein ACQJBY_048754 [Aegilops geniculata]